MKLWALRKKYNYLIMQYVRTHVYILLRSGNCKDYEITSCKFVHAQIYWYKIYS